VTGLLLDEKTLFDRSDAELTLRAMLTHAADGVGTVSVGPTSMSWTEFARLVDRRAAGLLRLGVLPGDRVASLMTDRIECLELMFATATVGAVWVPLGPFLKGRFLRHQLLDAEPTVLVVDRPGWRESAPALTDCSSLRWLVHVEDSDGLPDVTVPTQPWASIDDARPQPFAQVDGRMVAAILYTSGTTGPAKGCMMSHSYFAKAGGVHGTTFGVRAEDVVHSAFPLFHGAALNIVMVAVNAGASYRSPGTFSATTYWRDVRATGTTVIVGAGAMAHALLARPVDDTDCDHTVRLAEWIPLTATTQDAFSRRFGVEVLSEHYGQTECMMITLADPEGTRNRSSLGPPSLLTEVAIMGDDGRLVPDGTVGDIVVRPRTSSAMFDGYWRNPEATVRAWRGLWHHTGDYGRRDPDGFLHFIDRRDDCVRRRGENVSSLEVEAAIRELPAIADAAILAVPSSMSEDDIKAVLVLEPGTRLEPAELFEAFASALPYYAVPRYVDIVEALPRTPNMKIRKYELRDRGHGPDTWDFESMGFTVSRERRRATS